MSVVDEILEEASQATVREIDREVLWGMLEGIGWTRVVLARFVDNNHAVDITHWLTLNTKKAYERNGKDFLFEDKRDAAWFILKWK